MLLFLSLIGIGTSCCSEIKDSLPFPTYPLSIISVIIFGGISIDLLVGFSYAREVTYGYTPLFRIESAYNSLTKDSSSTLRNNISIQNTPDYNLKRCNYSAKYYDLQKRELVNFQCQEEIPKMNFAYSMEVSRK